MECMGKKEPRPRRLFTPEFTAATVELRRRGDRSVRHVPQDFDLTETAVRRWVEQIERDSSERDGGSLTTTRRRELAQTRGVVELLRIYSDAQRAQRSTDRLSPRTRSDTEVHLHRWTPHPQRVRARRRRVRPQAGTLHKPSTLCVRAVQPHREVRMAATALRGLIVIRWNATPRPRP